MKTIFSFLVMVSAVLFTAGAQMVNAAKVPDAVRKSFAKQFPGVEPKWEKEHGRYEAGFVRQGMEISLLFENNGDVAETETQISITQLPAPVTAYVRKNFTNATIKEASRIVKANGEINFEAEVRKTDLLFDGQGVFLKAVKD